MQTIHVLFFAYLQIFYCSLKSIEYSCSLIKQIYYKLKKKAVTPGLCLQSDPAAFLNNTKRQGTCSKVSFNAPITERHHHLRDGIAKNFLECNAMARTLRMHKVRTVALRTDKHAVEKKWCRRECTVRSPTAPLELRWRYHSSFYISLGFIPRLRRFNCVVSQITRTSIVDVEQ